MREKSNPPASEAEIKGQRSKRPEAKISKEEIKYVAKLSNIDITQKEQEKYSKDLSEVIDYNMNHLNEINTDNVNPTAHAVGEKSVMREDSTSPGLSAEEALKDAPEEHNNFFKVKHIFGEE